MANAHRRRNNVDRIKINGAWCLEENEIREGIGNALKSLLSSSGDWRPSISGLQLESLDQLDASTLESPFTEEEVYNALLSCNGDNALGPDGLSMAFWQFAWDFVKADVLLGAEDLGDFRPISLVGSLYKWLAKVLANRLKKVVGKVISKAQGAFVEGRQILDAVLIANEAIDSTLKNNESAILCFFQSSKGLRQGDPLSPYLFVIAMEVFSAFLQRAVEGGIYQGVGKVENMDDLAWEFGCKVGSLPSTYLGMPLGLLSINISLGWSGRTLPQTETRKDSKGLPWGGGNLERKPHLVRWEVVCLSKKKGGLGEGEFWRDKWCGDSPLCSSFPSLFALTVDKEESVADVWDSLAEGDGGLESMLFKSFNDWEVEEASSLMEQLHRSRVIEVVEDRVSWTELRVPYLECECAAKISFFAWEATWGKTLTLDKFFGVSWVLPYSVKETLLSWHGSFVGKKRKKGVESGSFAHFWTV
ncbi:hypothetical protein CK203_095174 [Vitis vinifera]|uniref:Uncharacterized protein n=1 Tax=Vitis vinifera TaxID=29760 RepID=A0A438E142_VITVI|nr:hypothetical protein CK203_095174 [Vitis vinifera]